MIREPESLPVCIGEYIGDHFRYIPISGWVAGYHPYLYRPSKLFIRQKGSGDMCSDSSKFIRSFFEFPVLFCAIPSLSFPKSLTIKGHIAFPRSACNRLFSSSLLILISHRPTRTDTDNFLWSNSPQLAAEYNRHYSFSPIPRQLCCGEPSLNQGSLFWKS